MIHFVNCFEVPAGREDEFLSLWLEVNTYMRAKPGYLGHTLYRSVAPDALYRFVNTAQWASPQALTSAHDQGFRDLARSIGERGFTSTPSMYEIAHEGAPIAA